MGVMKLRGVLILMSAAVLVLTGCDSDDEHQATPPPTPIESPSASPSPSPTASQTPETVTGSDCGNEAVAVADGETISASSWSGTGASSGSGTGADAAEVETAVVVDREAPPGCQAFLVATIGGVTSSNVIAGDLQLDFNPPQIRTLANVDGAEGPEAFVTVQAGASTEFGALFLLDPVRPVVFDDPERGTGDLLAFGGSVTHLDGATCAPGESGTVVISSAGSQGKRYRLERRFYRFQGARLIKVRSEILRASFHELVDDYPEFSTDPFFDCFP